MILKILGKSKQCFINIEYKLLLNITTNYD